MGDVFEGPWGDEADGDPIADVPVDGELIDLDFADAGWVDDPFDQRIRAELLTDLGPTENAYAALEALTPSFTRAARVQRAQMVLASAAVVVAFFGGVGLAVSLVSTGADESTAAADQAETDWSSGRSDDQRPTLEVDVPSDEPVDGAVEPDDESVADHDDAEGDTSVDEPTSVPDDHSDDSAGGETTTATESAAEATGSTTAQATTTSRPTTARPTTTRPASTTSLGSGESRLESDCGSVIVRVRGNSISVVEVDANPGYQTDVKSTGPEEIEVSFERTRDHCEISAKVVNGRLVVDDDDD